MMKLRKIVVDNLEYLYSVKTSYIKEGAISLLQLRIFLSGHKVHPLIIEFRTADDLIQGDLLNIGVSLNNTCSNAVEIVNINRPLFIGKLIAAGVKNGWTGENDIGMQDGLEYLTALGYEVDRLKPSNKNN